MPVNLFETLKGFGVKPGRKRIVSAEWMVHQFPLGKEKNAQSEPFLCLAIGYLPLGPDGKPLDDAEIDYSVQVGPKWGKTLDTCKFAPAQEIGKPLPLRVGSRGSYIEAIADEASFYRNSKPGLFFTRLTEIGGEKFVNKMQEVHMNVGALVGTICDVYELNSHNDGIGDDGKPMKDTKITAIKSVEQFGWETPAGQTAYVNGATNGVNGVATTTTATAPIEVAIDFLKMAADLNKDKTHMKLDDIIKSAMPIGSKMKPRLQGPEREAVKTLIATPEFWENDDVVNVAMLDQTTGQVEFNRV